MNEGFSEAYSLLNKAQKQAVDYIEGPLLVVAGPGTGKTQLLSLRVANILDKTDTDPSQVLCLTFTNAAANNMISRLTSLVGPSARKVSVSTFHSFAAEIMQLYPDYFWNGARLSVVPEAIQKSIIEDILSQLPLDNPLALKFAGNYTATTDVLEGLRLTKEAGLTPDKLEAMIKLNEAYIDLIEESLGRITEDRLSLKSLEKIKDEVMALPEQDIDETIAPLRSLSSVIKDSLLESIKQAKLDGKTTAVSKWKSRWVQTVNNHRGLYAERQRNLWWASLAQVYRLYRDHLHERGYYDYSDMIVEVIASLEQNPELLSLVQERYLYVLIDEFQDTNAAQLRLAHLVSSSPVVGDKPNLMAVGDDDQSIFAFNGAELNNMLSFAKLYPSVKTVVLSNNYRSSQAILDTSSSIIGQAETRLALTQNFSKNLNAATTAEPGEIKHYVYPTREHQLAFITQHIKDNWTTDSSQTIAVLARSHSSLRDLASYLFKAEVPFRYEQQNNILEHELIKQIVHLSEVTVAIAAGDRPRASYHLANLLTYPAWKVEAKTLWILANEINAKHSNWLDYILESKDEDLSSIGNWLLALSEQARHEALPIIIDYLIGLRPLNGYTSPLRAYYLKSSNINSAYLASLSGLATLNNLVHEFVATSKAEPGLGDFVKFIGINNRIVDNSWYVSSNQAIDLLSVHKAKGLEFDTVYIIDAIDSEWRPRRVGRKPPANLPLQPYGELFDDYARLAYVAATRSRRSLIIGSFNFDGNNQPINPSPLFSGLDSTSIDKISDNDSQAALETKLSFPRLDSQDEKLLLEPRLENYRLSATGLIQFLDVSQGGPKQFLERQLLRLPSLNTPHMAYGTAMHFALQAAQNLVNQNAFSLNAVQEAFTYSLKKQYMASSDIKRYMEHGTATLNKLFNNFNFNLAKGDLSEIIVSDLALGTAKVNGTLDHIHSENGSLLISDYKTGSPLTSFTTKDQTKAIKAWRQRTQLLFYCLLARDSQRVKTTNSIRAQIIYVEADNPKQLVLGLTPSEAELNRLTGLIEAVWHKIQLLDFIDTSSYPKTIQGIKDFENNLLGN